MARKKWKKKSRILKESPKVQEKKINKSYILIGIFLISITGYLILEGDESPSYPVIQGDYVILKDKPDSHVAGKVTLVEFFDFYCSHCYRFYKERWPVLEEKYGDKVELFELGYPLKERSIPPLAAYEVAVEQGKGNDIKNLIFTAIHEEGRDVSDVQTLAAIAQSVGLDKVTFEERLQSYGFSKVEEYRRLGNSFALTGTPTFIIDGNIKVTDSSVENLVAVIDSILERDET